MKSKYLFITALLSVALIIASSCKKIDQNPEYPFTISVKTADDTTTVQNVFVEVGVPSQINSELAFEGFTDANGQISFTYHSDAVFRVRATRGVNPITYIGCTYVRLEPNKNVNKTVYLERYDPQSPGCDLIFQ